ncbi:MAG TPA: biotin-dependent carboxyltransferase family protein [Candidatus Micrarchaeaceae archaeon]|nr:biotin-dependent carboxyltransferase family protein [Candidatus Micrarchaeaceae archaeon]
MIPALQVEKAGLLTTVQDLGRLNAIAAGVQPGGAMDRFAHSAANLLVGNDPGLATLECTLLGPALLAEQTCLIAITGADLDPRVNGAAAPLWTSLLLGPGDRLTFAGRRQGARTYIAIAGGFAADRWLGSLSTNLMTARGGQQGRPLKAGDVLSAAGKARKPGVAGRSMSEHLRPAYSDHTLHAVAGPHLKRLDPESRRQLFQSPYEVGRDSDRMGYRLDGPKLGTTGPELLSFGLVAGAVQVPPGGLPILLMADHQTAGGYPVVATVVSASLPIAAQLLPGHDLQLAEITVARAQKMRQTLAAALETLRGEAG